MLRNFFRWNIKIMRIFFIFNLIGIFFSFFLFFIGATFLCLYGVFSFKAETVLKFLVFFQMFWTSFGHIICLFHIDEGDETRKVKEFSGIMLTILHCILLFLGKQYAGIPALSFLTFLPLFFYFFYRREEDK